MPSRSAKPCAFVRALLRSKIYEYPTLAFTPQSTAEAACDWLWQDETGVVSNVGFDELPGAVDLGAAANCFIVSAPGNYKFKAVKGDGSAVDGVDGYVYFTAGAAKGNAVIAALVNRQVAWSWHIWRTDAPAEKEAAAGCTILDRNLGATSVTPGDVSSYGLYYQWGRKDPFVGAKELGKDAPIGGASETAAFGTQTAAYEKNTIDQTAYAFDVIGNDDNTITDCVAYAVQHPTTFIKYVVSVGNSGVSTWFNSDLSNFSDLWGAVSGRKSVYDPCPAGYKVPVDSAEAWVRQSRRNVVRRLLRRHAERSVLSLLRLARCERHAQTGRNLCQSRKRHGADEPGQYSPNHVLQGYGRRYDLYDHVL